MVHSCSSRETTLAWMLWSDGTLANALFLLFFSLIFGIAVWHFFWPFLRGYLGGETKNDWWNTKEKGKSTWIGSVDYPFCLRGLLLGDFHVQTHLQEYPARVDLMKDQLCWEGTVLSINGSEMLLKWRCCITQLRAVSAKQYRVGGSVVVLPSECLRSAAPATAALRLPEQAASVETVLA